MAVITLVAISLIAGVTVLTFGQNNIGLNFGELRDQGPEMVDINLADQKSK